MDFCLDTQEKLSVHMTDYLLYVSCIFEDIPYSVSSFPLLKFKCHELHFCTPKTLGERKVRCLVSCEEAAKIPRQHEPVLVQVLANCDARLFNETRQMEEEIVFVSSLVVVTSVAPSDGSAVMDASSTSTTNTSLPYLPLVESCNSCCCSQSASASAPEQDHEESSAEGSPEFVDVASVAGCSFDRYQPILREIRQLVEQNHIPQAKLVPEPNNAEDSNAISVQIHVNNVWCSVGYIPGRKLQKVWSSQRNGRFVGVEVLSVRTRWQGGHRPYICRIGLRQRGNWPRDNVNYVYNQPL